MINSADFTKRIQKIMDKNELNASSFAEAIQVGRSSISHILSGRNKPSLDLVMNIVAHFPEVDLYWLLNGKGTYPKTEQSIATPVITKPATAPLPESIPDLEKNSTHRKVETNAPDLFSPPQVKEERELDFKDTGKNITKVIILYSDGSFKDYVPQ